MTEHGVEGRVVAVTGAGRGIGRGIALHLARNGASVVLAEYRADRLDAVAGELGELGAPHLAVTCDVGAAFAAGMADHPMGRDGDPEDDIAPVVLFLCSDATRFMTGQTLMVDGGALLFA